MCAGNIGSMEGQASVRNGRDGHMKGMCGRRGGHSECVYGGRGVCIQNTKRLVNSHVSRSWYSECIRMVDVNTGQAKGKRPRSSWQRNCEMVNPPWPSSYIPTKRTWWASKGWRGPSLYDRVSRGIDGVWRVQRMYRNLLVVKNITLYILDPT